MLHVIMASNNRWVVPASMDARRFVMLTSPAQEAGPGLVRCRSIRRWTAGGCAAMLHDLLARDLGEWHPRQIIRTAALATNSCSLSTASIRSTRGGSR